MTFFVSLRDFFVQRFVPINADKKNKKVSSKAELVTSKADFVMVNKSIADFSNNYNIHHKVLGAGAFG